MTLSEAFAHFIQHPVPLGEEEVYLCTRSILDTVGAMVLGGRTGVVKKSARVIPRAGEKPLWRELAEAFRARCGVPERYQRPRAGVG